MTRRATHPVLRAIGVGLVLCAVSLLVACSKGEQGSAEKLCAAVRADPAAATLFGNFDPSDAPHALVQLRAARITLGELRSAAPGAMHGDLDVEIAYVQDLIDGLSAGKDLDAAQAAAVVRQVTAKHPDVSKASATLAAYSKAHCAPG